jgi:hypothetical protein
MCDWRVYYTIHMQAFFLVNSVHTIWWNVNISINLFIEFNKNFLTMFHLTCKIIQCLHDGLTLKINKN